MSSRIENDMTPHHGVRDPHAAGSDALEQAIRSRHADATAHLSARTQAQLRLRLRAAIAQPSRTRTAMPRPMLWLATACSMALLLLGGVQWRAGSNAIAPVTADGTSTETTAMQSMPTQSGETQSKSMQSTSMQSTSMQSTSTRATSMRSAAPPAADDAGELVATLDETPDLYLWLASDDANALSTE